MDILTMRLGMIWLSFLALGLIGCQEGDHGKTETRILAAGRDTRMALGSSALAGVRSLILAGGQAHASGNVQLAMQTDGNLVLYKDGAALWHSQTYGRDCGSDCLAAFQSDGNLVLYQDGVAYWNSGTAGHAGATLGLGDRAPFIEIQSVEGTRLWDGAGLSSFVLSAGESRSSGSLLLAMQADGNLVVYKDGVPLWNSETYGRDCTTGCLMAFQSDGNLVLYQNGAPFWSSGTSGNSGARLYLMETSPFIEIVSGQGDPVWTGAGKLPESLQDPRVDEAMEALWNGQASFQVRVSMQIPTVGSAGTVEGLMNQGTQIVPMNGVWYLFSREYWYSPVPAQCQADFARVVVRESGDKGQTWSPPTVVAQPDLSRGECAVADGHALFDAESQTWHYLSQVLTAQSIWNIHHYTRQGGSPMGAFTSDPANPVIRSGDLASRICGPGKACPAGSSDEGTPEISYKRNGFYYVTFHSAKYTQGSSVITGYRLVAKTRDFRTWITADADLPNDAIFSPQDCSGWNVPWNGSTGCIGGGHASSLITARHTYMIIEAADLSLGCTAGQNWVFGLVRTGAGGFARSGGWEQFNRNPIMDAGATTPCALQYQRFFVDEGKVYLSYWRFTVNSNSRFHIAELVPAEPRDRAPVASILTGFSFLRSWGPACDPNNSTSMACNSAISRFCSSQGYAAGGYGPANQFLDLVEVLCLAESPGVQRMLTSFSLLKAFVPSCDPENPASMPCMSAVSRFCSSQGYEGGGFGPSEAAAGLASVTCVGAPRAQKVLSTFSSLRGFHDQCDASRPWSLACNSAIRASCVSSGFTGGFGMLEYDGDASAFSCVR